MSNSGKSVLSDFVTQTPRSRFKNLWRASVFFYTLLGVWKSDEKLFLVFDTLHQKLARRDRVISIGESLLVIVYIWCRSHNTSKNKL